MIAWSSWLRCPILNLTWQSLTHPMALMPALTREVAQRLVTSWQLAKSTTLETGINYPPPHAYFAELQRVSKNQIIWGGNYFIDDLHNTNCMIVWNKLNGENEYADCELAWTSFKSAVRMFTWRWSGFLQEVKQERIHPTEKPIQLYEWLLQKYAKDGDKILDTHGGSMSHAIACHRLGFDLTIIEKDPVYYRDAKERLIREQQQLKLF